MEIEDLREFMEFDHLELRKEFNRIKTMNDSQKTQAIDEILNPNTKLNKNILSHIEEFNSTMREKSDEEFEMLYTVSSCIFMLF
jgi:hypothetical protein